MDGGRPDLRRPDGLRKDTLSSGTSGANRGFYPSRREARGAAGGSTGPRRGCDGSSTVGIGVLARRRRSAA